MKFFLSILLSLYIFSGNTDELKRESSGFSETEEFMFENNKVIHYKNKQHRRIILKIKDYQIV